MHIFRGGTHPLFNYRLTPDSTYYKIELLTTDFLRRHGYLTRRAAARLRHETQLRLKALETNHGEKQGRNYATKKAIPTIEKSSRRDKHATRRINMP